MIDGGRDALVLVVEDDPKIARLLEMDLQIEGYSVMVAMDGLTAVDIARDHLPTVILLDGMLPGLDGFGVMRELKSTPATASIPIIFVSARNHPDIIREAIDGGAVKYFVKPFEADELMAEVGNLVELGANR